MQSFVSALVVAPSAAFIKRPKPNDSLHCAEVETLPPTQKCNVLNRVWVQELGPGGSKRLLWQKGEAHGSEVAQTFTVRKGPGWDL